MNLNAIFLKELNEEAKATRKILGAIPVDKLDWQPHSKSMTIRYLGTHIAELPAWVALAFTTDELDFATTPYQQPEINSVTELLALFEKSMEEGRSVLTTENEKKLSERWVLKEGDQIYMDITKGELVRHAMSQIIHHRAQMGVNLRLLNISVPATYGPSADDMSFE